MTSKFEQLIEYVINDEENKARELFHEIVVEKSREIYENLMDEDSEEDLDEAKEEDNEGEELDEDAEEDLDEDFGGDASNELIDDVEAEEQGMSEEEDMEFDGEEHGEEGGEEGLEDRVVDLEDKLDELMAEFEAMMGDDNASDDFGAEGGDELEMDDTSEFDDGEEDSEEVEFDLSENVSLKAAPAPVKSEEGSVNKKSTVAANAGASGPVGSTVKPVPTATGEEKGRSAPGTKELIGKVGNSPAQGTQKPAPATKPTLAQASGVNTKSPVARG